MSGAGRHPQAPPAFSSAAPMPGPASVAPRRLQRPVVPASASPLSFPCCAWRVGRMRERRERAIRGRHSCLSARLAHARRVAHTPHIQAGEKDDGLRAKIRIEMSTKVNEVDIKWAAGWTDPTEPSQPRSREKRRRTCGVSIISQINPSHGPWAAVGESINRGLPRRARSIDRSTA